MAFSDEDIREFKLEASDLLEAAEKCLLSLDQGEEFKLHYDAIFRAFHSIKGAAGMMDMTDLQGHLHQLEGLFVQRKMDSTLSKQYIDFFLRGVDGARELLDGKAISFQYSVESGVPSGVEAPSVKVETPQAPSPPLAASLEGVPALPIVGVPTTKSLGRVLIVDDEPEIVEILCDILNRNGFTTLGLTQTEQVMPTVESYAFDVLLSDVRMPGLDGAKLLANLRKIEVAMPVIFVSGFVEKEFLIGTIPNDVFAVIEKPFSEKQIIDVCTRAVQRPRAISLLTKALHLLMFQYADLDNYLAMSGKEMLQKTLQNQVKTLLAECRELKQDIIKQAS